MNRIYFIMNEKEEVLEKIKIENWIWILYLFLIGFSFYSNYLETEYIKTDNQEAKEKYRKSMIIIFSIALLVYLYFFKDNLEDVKKLTPYDNPKKVFLNKANLLASTLIVIAGCIFLFIAIFDTEIDTEIAFS